MYIYTYIYIYIYTHFYMPMHLGPHSPATKDHLPILREPKSAEATTFTCRAEGQSTLSEWRCLQFGLSPKELTSMEKMVECECALTRYLPDKMPNKKSEFMSDRMSEYVGVCVTVGMEERHVDFTTRSWGYITFGNPQAQGRDRQLLLDDWGADFHMFWSKHVEKLCKRMLGSVLDHGGPNMSFLMTLGWCLGYFSWFGCLTRGWFWYQSCAKVQWLWSWWLD